jgi:Domain of unknown function (DUF4476)
MKKTFTLLTALFLSVILFGQSKLSITNSSNADIRVMIDGKKYPAGNNVIMLNNLQSGNHSVKIFRASTDRYRSQGNGRSGGYQLVYSNNLFIKQQYHVDITINRFGKTFIDEQMIDGGYYGEDDDWGVDNNDQYYDRDSKGVMDKITFDQFKQSLKKESYDDTRLKIGKQFIAANYFNAQQVKELVAIFSFEESKLEMAKYAYDYTVDKGNYFMIIDVFSFSSSKDTLMEYIKNRK